MKPVFEIYASAHKKFIFNFQEILQDCILLPKAKKNFSLDIFFILRRFLYFNYTSYIIFLYVMKSNFICYYLRNLYNSLKKNVSNKRIGKKYFSNN